MPRRFWASALAAALVASGAAGCGDDGSAPDGEAVLHVYVSLPLSGPNARAGRDAAHGARIALRDAGGEAAGMPVEVTILNDADADGWSPVKVGENARAATQDSTAIAYLGDFESGASRTSIPITNVAGLLQVSPASAATDLVDEFPGSDQISELQSTGERTFGRVIPGDEAQARAAAFWADDMDIDSVAIASDDSAFGKDMADTFRDSLARASISQSGDLLFFAGEQGQTPSLAQSHDGPQLATDAALLPDRVESSSGRLLATSAALATGQLPPVAGEFVGRFVATYGRTPGRYAAYGYEAMAVILDSIDRASDPTDRSAVVDAFFDTADRASILGTYSISENGETTFDHLSGFEIEDGRARAVEFLDPN